jgi:hypothetical protein
MGEVRKRICTYYIKLDLTKCKCFVFIVQDLELHPSLYVYLFSKDSLIS